jgi:hypothetical protein
MNDIKAYVDYCSSFGDPIIYNNIKIYPVLAKDYQRFLGVVDILKIEKNKVPDVEVIQMSYLYYLIQLIRFDEMVRYAFMTLLQLSFHLDYNEDKLIEGFEPDDILLQELPNNEEVCFINGWDVEIKTRGKVASLVIGGHSISSGEFEDVRRIILFQNLHDFDEIEMNMSDDFRRVVEKYYELKNKGIHSPTVEDKALVIISHTSYTLETVKLLPMRSFDNLFHNIVAETDYIATKALEIHLPKGKSIDHWIYKPERQKYMDVFQDADSVAKKVTSM